MPRPRRGFSLLELLVACLVLVAGLGALASGTARALRALADARLDEEAAERAARRFEWLRGLPCAARAGGSVAEGAFVERWTVATHGDGAATRLELVVARRDRDGGERRFATVAPC